MQLVVETLVRSIPAVSHVMMFGAFLFGIFAILGVQLFAGRFGRCNQVRPRPGPLLQCAVPTGRCLCDGGGVNGVLSRACTGVGDALGDATRPGLTAVLY